MKKVELPFIKSAAPLLALPRSVKRLIVILLDVFLAILSVWAAFYLRIDQLGLPQNQQIYVYLLAPLLAFPVFIRFGLYRAIFRYTGMAAPNPRTNLNSRSPRFARLTDSFVNLAVLH